ncbi:MAG: ATP-binding protein [Anaerolineae bacterium]|nr:ATP-binding protein [Anaerolineae bacterium]
MHIEPDLPPIVGDLEYLTVALARLVDNAIKFSPPDSRIELRAALDEQGRPTLSVTDFGRGIPPEELDNIFDAFYQIDRQKYEDQGAGSGLAIVRGIAQVHQAEITVRSALGKGSTFALHFRSGPPAELH